KRRTGRQGEGGRRTPGREQEKFAKLQDNEGAPSIDQEAIEKHQALVDQLQEEAREPEEQTFVEVIENQHDDSEDRRWSAEEWPLVAAWLDANEKALELVLEASSRPKCFEPHVFASGSGSIMAILLPLPGTVREGAKSLLIRAMLRIQTGQTDE